MGEADICVKVAVRIRPLIQKEVNEGSREALQVRDGRQVVVNGATRSFFTFDHAYGPEVKQEKIYVDCVKPLVDRVLKGYNATLFAYGQTGSGKTWTIGSGYLEELERDTKIAEALTLANQPTRTSTSCARRSGMLNTSAHLDSTLNGRDSCNALGSLAEVPLRLPRVTERSGVITRAVRDLFREAHARRETQQVAVRVSFTELHNEQLVDLLAAEQTLRPDTGADTSLNGKSDMRAGAKVRPGGAGGPKLQIREGPNGQIWIAGLAEQPVTDAFETLQTLERGCARRATANTAMNERSSRSHAIFTMHVTVTCLQSGAQTESKFNFVDLAGCERLKRTLAEGDRMKEGVNINLGLLALGNVINGLCELAKRNAVQPSTAHIPYRDSKLTRILQDSLGGNAHTVMVACCSSADSNLDETVSTLRYADRAKQIRNRPTVNHDARSAELERLRAEVVRLTDENATLRRLPSGPVQERRPLADAVTQTLQFPSVDAELLAENTRQLNELRTENTRLLHELRDQVTRCAAAELACDRVSEKLENVETEFAEARKALEATLNSIALETEQPVSASAKASEKQTQTEMLTAALTKLRGSLAKLGDRLADDEDEDDELDQLATPNGQQTPQNQLEQPTTLNASHSNARQSPFTPVSEKHKLQTPTRPDQSDERTRSWLCEMARIENSLREKEAALRKLCESSGQVACNSNTRTNADAETETNADTVADAQARAHAEELARLQTEKHSLEADTPAQPNAETEKIRKLNEARRERIRELEHRIAELRRAELDNRRLVKANADTKHHMEALSREIVGLKRAKARLIKENRAVNVELARSRAEHARAARTLEQRARRNELAASRLAKQTELHRTILRRRNEDVVALTRRLKTLQTQLQRRADSPTAKNDDATPAAPSTIYRALLDDVELAASVAEARARLEQLETDAAQLERTRSRLQSRLDGRLSPLSPDDDDDHALCSMTNPELELELKFVTAKLSEKVTQIGELRPVLEQLQSRASNSTAACTNTSLSTPKTPHTGTVRSLSLIRTANEARYALKVLFDSLTESRVRAAMADAARRDAESELLATRTSFESQLVAFRRELGHTWHEPTDKRLIDCAVETDILLHQERESENGNSLRTTNEELARRCGELERQLAALKNVAPAASYEPGASMAPPPPPVAGATPKTNRRQSILLSANPLLLSAVRFDESILSGHIESQPALPRGVLTRAAMATNPSAQPNTDADPNSNASKLPVAQKPQPSSPLIISRRARTRLADSSRMQSALANERKPVLTNDADATRPKRAEKTRKRRSSSTSSLQTLTKRLVHDSDSRTSNSEDDNDNLHELVAANAAALKQGLFGSPAAVAPRPRADLVRLRALPATENKDDNNDLSSALGLNDQTDRRRMPAPAPLGPSKRRLLPLDNVSFNTDVPVPETPSASQAKNSGIRRFPLL